MLKAMILIEKLQRNKGESPAEFERVLRSICTMLSINPSWLMMVMWSESRLNAQAVKQTTR
jgi:hypothetical protein